MALFGDVAGLAEDLAAEGGRLKKRAAIAEAIGRVAEESVEDAGRFAMYLAGEPFAESDPRKLNAGGALLTKAVKEISGAEDAALTAAYRRHGDMGAAAFDLLEARGGLAATDHSHRALTLVEVEAIFARMAVAATTKIRGAAVAELLRRATPLEAKYLLKLMLGDMRIGVKQSLVEEAIAVASGAEVSAVRHAVMLEADLAWAVRRAFGGTLGEARMRLFHPLGFMLASPVETPEEAVDRFSEKPAKPPAVKKPKRGRGKATGAEAEGAEEVNSSAEDFPDASPTDSLPKQEGVEQVADLAESSAGDAAGGPASTGHIQALLEDKYDGMRAQVHCGDTEQPNRVAIYSRNREDVTDSFPELEEAFARVAETGVGAVILDGEILGWDLGESRALPFAVLGQRIGRKRVTNEWRQQVPVVFMAFDVMYADGALTLELPLRDRRNRLEAIAERLVETTRSPLALPEVPKAPKGRRSKATAEQAGLFVAESSPDAGAVQEPGGVAEQPMRLMISPARLVESAEDIDRAYADARARANEGVMLKAAGSAYLPGRRGLAWAKLKRELATLDVVITGAEFGSGRRAPYLSDYTFAVRGSSGELLNVGKAYSGVTDAEIVELTEWLKAHTIEDFGHFRTVEPQIVLEVAFNNIMRSDRHASGFALRFPRIIRLRNDKPVSEIDTVNRVEEVYQSQVDRPLEQVLVEPTA